MATPATGQPHIGVAQSNNANTNPPPMTYAAKLASHPHQHNPLESLPQENQSLPIKLPEKINGRPTMVWNKREVQQSIASTKLIYAIIGKFTHGSPEINDLRKVIPVQCNIKGHCVIGSLDYRSILIRCALFEDYVSLLTKGHWLKLGREPILMRTLKWNPWSDPRKETSIVVGWISFPNLPPNFFVKECVFSLALAVGKPLHLDAATLNHTRPSCARVKVEIDLLGELPEEIDIVEVDEESGKTHSKCIKIVYDYLPKYCTNCFLQGHDIDECWILHPHVHEEDKDHEAKQDNSVQLGATKDQVSVQQPRPAAPLKVLTSGKVVGEAGPSGTKVDQLTKTGGVSVSKQNVRGWQNPNRNPNAWRVNNKVINNKGKTQQQVDDGITVNVNAFEVLQVDEEAVQTHEQLTGGSSNNEDKGLSSNPTAARKKNNDSNFNEMPDKDCVGNDAAVNGVEQRGTVNDGVNNIQIQDKSAHEHGEVNSKGAGNDFKDEGPVVLHAVNQTQDQEKGRRNNKDQLQTDSTRDFVHVSLKSIKVHIDTVNGETKDSAHVHFGTVNTETTKYKAAGAGASNVATQEFKDEFSAQYFRAESNAGNAYVESNAGNTLMQEKDSLLKGQGVKTDIHIMPAHAEVAYFNDRSPGVSLIPTAELQRLCQSSAPLLGKAYLNINATSFLPKSLMQVVMMARTGNLSPRGVRATLLSQRKEKQQIEPTRVQPIRNIKSKYKK